MKGLCGCGVAMIFLLASVADINPLDRGKEDDAGRNKKTVEYRNQPKKPRINIKKLKERNEQLEGQIEFLEAAFRLVIQSSPDRRFTKRIKKLRHSSKSVKEMQGWNQARRRILEFLDEDRK